MSELDELDKRILLQLQQNANLTNQELAEKVHASAPTCLRRVQRLHKSGFIHRQVAILNPQAFAASLQAIVEITLDKQHSEAMAAFELWVKEDAAVLQCYRVSPGPDFVLMLQVRDMPAYHELAHRLFSEHANVRNVRSFFVQHRAKFETALPANIIS